MRPRDVRARPATASGCAGSCLGTRMARRFVTAHDRSPGEPSHDPELLAHFHEGAHRLVEVVAGVRGGHLAAHARLPLRHHREPESGDEHALRRAAGRSSGSRWPSRPTMIGMIGVSPASGLKPASMMRSRKYRAFSRSSCTRSGCCLDELHRRQRARATVGGSAFEKSCGTRALRQVIAQRRRSGDEPAGGAAERLAERRGDDVHFAEHAEMLGRAAARLRRAHRWHASRRSRAPRRGRGRSGAGPGSGAIEPSIEKTPSLQTIRRFAPLAPSSFARRSSRSACL